MRKIGHNLIVFLIIMCAGIFGGIANYLYYDLHRDGETLIAIFSKASFLKSVFLGIIAAAIMPLFLNVISSDLLEDNRQSASSRRYFVFTSLCLLAALFSNKFLSGMYNEAVANNSEEIKELKVEASRVRETVEATAEAPMISQKIEASRVSGLSFEEVISKNKLTTEEIELLTRIYKADGMVFENDLLFEMDDTSEGEKVILSLVAKKLLKRYEIDGTFALQLRKAVFVR